MLQAIKTAGIVGLKTALYLAVGFTAFWFLVSFLGCSQTIVPGAPQSQPQPVQPPTVIIERPARPPFEFKLEIEEHHHRR